MLDQDTITKTDTWLRERRIDDIECMVTDIAGIARGKSMPRIKFIEGLSSGELRVPESIFGLTINGDYAYSDALLETERDVILRPDLATLCTTPWQPEPTAAVICDTVYADDSLVGFSPRTVLKRVLDCYASDGLTPIVAPEFEFYLLNRNEDGVGSEPKPPVGLSGRKETAAAPYSIDSLDEFAPFFDEVYDACEAQHIDVDTLIHEAGTAQYEFNVNHGPALNVADQSFLFKRIIRQVAIRHGMYATFMATPYPDSFGSAMHVHQSVEDTEGRNIFAGPDGENTPVFLSHIAGLQKYLPAAMPLIAPYVNSYRRFALQLSAPTNTHWSRENRSVGLRVPSGPDANRRVENRVAGSDVNPYLAIAVSLACGYLGMRETLEPTPEFVGAAYETQDRALPRHFLESLKILRTCEPLREILGPAFVDIYVEAKEMEYESHSAVINPWDMRHLMLTV